MQMSPPAASVWREDDAPRIVNFRNPSCAVAFALSSFYNILFNITFVYIVLLFLAGLSKIHAILDRGQPSTRKTQVPGTFKVPTYFVYNICIGVLCKGICSYIKARYICWLNESRLCQKLQIDDTFNLIVKYFLKVNKYVQKYIDLLFILYY